VSDSERAEAEALTLAAGRLRERFPTIPPETIDEVLADFHREYDGRPIREFVPLLVERDARDHLSERIPRQRGVSEAGSP
jgi:hypothetical protein